MIAMDMESVSMNPGIRWRAGYLEEPEPWSR